MSTLSDETALELLRAAMPIDRSAAESDLWPRVRNRIERGAAGPPASDWLIVVALALLCLLRPSLAGMLLLHF